MPLRFGSTGALSNNLQQSIGPDNAAFTFSDYCAVNVTSARVRFTRPTSDGQGFETANPGARVRFKTNSSSLRVKLRYTNLVTRLDTYNAMGTVLVNGTVFQTFDRAQGANPIAYNLLLDFGSTVERTVEIVFPYCASLDFEGLDLRQGATLSQAAARPSTRLVVIGDSITHGFFASKETTSWAWLLGAAKNWQVINHGYGGRRADSTDGTAAAGLNPDVATYLIGYNNFVDQTALATFKATYTSFINAFRAVNSTCKLYCLTPTYSPNTNTLTLANYRTQIVNALTTLANAKNVLVDGLTLFTNSNDRLVDTIHPNDTASAEMAAALAAVVAL